MDAMDIGLIVTKTKGKGKSNKKGCVMSHERGMKSWRRYVCLFNSSFITFHSSLIQAGSRLTSISLQ
jgi:hypothetical protein